MVTIEQTPSTPLPPSDPLSQNSLGYGVEIRGLDGILLKNFVSGPDQVGNLFEDTQQLFFGPGRDGSAQTGIFCSAYRLDWFFDMTKLSDPSIHSEVCALTFFSSCIPPLTPTSSPPLSPPCTGPCCLTAPYGYAEWMACIQSIPADSARKDATFSAVQKTLQLYVYRDINVNSGPPANIKVDYVRELDRIQSTSYTFEYELHSDLYLLFQSFHDPHTTYGSCFQALMPTIFQPWVLGSQIDDESQVIYIKATRFNGVDPFLEFHTDDFVGWKIISLDGVPAIQSLLDWGARYSYFKDPGARFNDVLANWGQQGFDFPIEKPLIVYVLQHPQTLEVVTLEVKWFGIFAVSGDQIESSCGVELKKRTDDTTPILTTTRIHRSGKIVLDSSPSNILESTGGQRYGLLLTPLSTDNQIGVLAFKSFFPDSDVFTSTNDAIKYFYNSLHVIHTLAIHRYGFRNLILDVSSNGGGYQVLIQFAVQYFGNLHTTDAQRMDYRSIHSPLTDDLVRWFTGLNSTQQQVASKNSIISQLATPKPLSSTGANPVPSDAWYFPGESIKYGGRTSLYSQRFELDQLGQDATAYFLSYAQQLPFFIPYAERDLLILSNGNCISACSFFLRQMRFYRASKIIAYGGLVGHTMEPDIADASVLDAHNISKITTLNQAPLFFDSPLPVENVPQVPSFISELRVSWEAAYLQAEKNHPLEFLPFPADYRLDTWEVESWNTLGATDARSQASVFFDCCFEWEKYKGCSPCSSATHLMITCLAFLIPFFCLLF